MWQFSLVEGHVSFLSTKRASAEGLQSTGPKLGWASCRTKRHIQAQSVQTRQNRHEKNIAKYLDGLKLCRIWTRVIIIALSSLGANAIKHTLIHTQFFGCKKLACADGVLVAWPQSSTTRLSKCKANVVQEAQHTYRRASPMLIEKGRERERE